MDYSNYAHAWTEQKENSLTLPIKANFSFMYKHHPRNWELEYFKSGKTTIPLFIPLLNRHLEKAGVNGVRLRGKKIDASLATAQAIERGWNILHPRDNDYLRIYPARGGSYYDTKFNKIENLAGEIIKTFDKQGFKKWRKELVAKGKIAIPHPEILKRKIVDLRRRIERHTRSQHIPEVAEKLKFLQKTIDDMKTAIDNLTKKGVQCYEFR